MTYTILFQLSDHLTIFTFNSHAQTFPFLLLTDGLVSPTNMCQFETGLQDAIFKTKIGCHHNSKMSPLLNLLRAQIHFRECLFTRLLPKFLSPLPRLSASPLVFNPHKFELTD